MKQRKGNSKARLRAATVGISAERHRREQKGKTRKNRQLTPLTTQPETKKAQTRNLSSDSNEALRNSAFGRDQLYHESLLELRDVEYEIN